MKKIVLASASPRRSELLKQIGLDFDIIPPDVNEDLDENLCPEEQVKALAYKKALHVAQMLTEPAIVIGADTIVVKGGILGKPQDNQDAFDMLKNLQGGWHEVITGIALVEAGDSEGNMKCCSDFEKTRVKMRNLDKHLIDAYINTGEPADKAGSYGIQGIGALLVEGIEGCYFNVVGLPLTKLSRMLEEFGVFALK